MCEHSCLRTYRADDLTENFHPFFWNYSVKFISNPVDVDTPLDAATPIIVNWFGAQDQGVLTMGLQAADLNRPSKALLACTICDSTVYPCMFDGVCTAGSCECSTGSSGSLCQSTPVGNGLCNIFFNTPEFDYDGGDCCESTCESTNNYSCGKSIIEIENSFGVSAFSYVGFPNCKDPRISSQISGSQTIFDIVQRGNVRCGTYDLVPEFMQVIEDVYSGFEVDLVSGSSMRYFEILVYQLFNR